MFDSVRYRMYAAVDDAVIPSGLLARIILEKRDGDIAYHIDLPEPFDLRLVEDEAGCFNPVDPVRIDHPGLPDLHPLSGDRT